MDQIRFGEINYFLKKLEKLQKKIMLRKKEIKENKDKNQNVEGNISKSEYCNDESEDFNLFSVSGFLELPTSKYSILYNKAVRYSFI